MGKFISLELEGEIELVQSQQNGKFYATTRKCLLSSTFDENTAKLMIGKQIEGTIERAVCESYYFTIPQTGEVIKLAHKYDYVPLIKPIQKTNALVIQ